MPLLRELAGIGLAGLEVYYISFDRRHRRAGRGGRPPARADRDGRLGLPRRHEHVCRGARGPARARERRDRPPRRDRRRTAGRPERSRRRSPDPMARADASEFGFAAEIPSAAWFRKPPPRQVDTGRLIRASYRSVARAQPRRVRHRVRNRAPGRHLVRSRYRASFGDPAPRVRAVLRPDDPLARASGSPPRACAPPRCRQRRHRHQRRDRACRDAGARSTRSPTASPADGSRSRASPTTASSSSRTRHGRPASSKGAGWTCSSTPRGVGCCAILGPAADDGPVTTPGPSRTMPGNDAHQAGRPRTARARRARASRARRAGGARRGRRSAARRVPARGAGAAAVPRLDARLPDEPQRLRGDGRAPARRRLRRGAVDGDGGPRRDQHLRDPRGGRAEGDRPAGAPPAAEGGEPGDARRADRLCGPRAGAGRAPPAVPGGRPVPPARRGAGARRPARAGVRPGRGRDLERRGHEVGRSTVGAADHLPGTAGLAVAGGAVHRESAISAWLPIVYGCDKTCTYCIVPFSRGPERSRPFDEIVDEARSLAAAGYREVTLLGQNVNSYGHDLPAETRFADVDTDRWAGRS